MISKFSRYLFFIGLFACMSLTAFAEGDVVCSGMVMGTTVLSNPNAGQIHFDSHGAPNGGVPEGLESAYEQVVDVSIIGGTVGLAPADRADAACVNEAEGTFNWDGVTGPYEYRVEGYAWGDNMGFIDFLGEEDFGVKIGEADGLGNREFMGYAWNGSSDGPVFGYIQFKGTGDNGGVPFDYGVTMDSAGNLSGYAWAEAGIWVDFTGVQIVLPGEEPVIPPETFCGGESYICVDVSLSAGIEDYWYDLDVYLMEEDGVTPLDLSVFDLVAEFVWEDTVKLNQLASSGGSFDKDEFPIKDGGGVLQKPISVADSEEFLKLFQEVIPGSGHYQLREKIRSVAPTSGSNTSLTTSTTQPMPFNNEFFVDALEIGGSVWTDDIEPNNLVLERIDYKITKESDTVSSGIVYPGGRGNGYELEFDPIVEVDTLYVADYQDEIIGYRNIPVTFTVGASSGRQFAYSNNEVYVVLGYDEGSTASECSDLGADVANFDYHFVVEGVETDYQPVIGGDGIWSLNPVTPDPLNPFIHGVVYSLSDLQNEVLLSAVAELPVFDPENELPCDVMQGPTLYTVVKYNVEGETVYYYNNKLPRILTAAYNPAAVIHGNVYAPKAFSPTASHATQETGNLAIDVVRNTINENLSKYLGEIELSAGASCTVTELGSDGSVVSDCGGSFEEFEVGDEHVLYFNETDVHLDTGVLNDDSDLYGNWVLIVKDASIYIDSDIYHRDMEDGKLVIVGLRSYEGECEDSNIYIHADVKNIDANIITDCSVFSYHSVAMPGADGIPDWDYEEMIEYLGNQKLIRGSLASRNTIGGADLDAEGLEYLLLGTGEVLQLPVSQEERLLAQLYDLNYLAFFRLDVELSANGLPIDQGCEKALTIEDMVQIQEYFSLGVGSPVYGENEEICDGIDLEPYDPDSGAGDLVVAGEDVENLARGLPEDSFDPVSIFAMSSGSFVFEKAGEVTSWN